MTIAEEIAEKAKETFNSSGFYCAESVLKSLAEFQDVDSEWIPAIASGFCSGVARTNGLCGALSGAIMGIGLKNGRQSSNEDIEKIYLISQKLIGDFKKNYKGTGCSELLGCDLNTDKGQAYYQENNLHVDCLNYVRTASYLAVEAILAEQS